MEVVLPFGKLRLSSERHGKGGPGCGRHGLGRSGRCAGWFDGRAALRARAAGELELGEAGFRVLVIESGSGAVAWDSGENAVHTGETWVAPYGAGPLSLNGALEAIVCCPPALG
jgi:hypothetical protein